MAQAQVVKPRTERIQPGIWRLKLPCPWPGVPHGNAWALQRGAGLVLVDTGVGGPGRLRMLDIALAQAGFGVDDIELVVCTHAHTDHYGLAASICEQTGCELWMHPRWEHIRPQADDPDAVLEGRLEVARMSGVPPAALERYRERSSGKPEDLIDGIRAPDRELVPGVEVESDIGTWQVIETPGHAPSHVCLHQPERRLLISGDHLLGRTVLFFDYGHTPDPFGEYLESLDRVEPLDVDLCLPGHGKPFRELGAKVTDVRREANELLARVRTALAAAEGEPTAFELVEAIVGRDKMTPGTAGFMLQIMLACLDHLAALGEAARVPDSDPQRWRASRARSALSFLVHPRKLWREHRRVAIGLLAALILAVAAVIVAYEELKRPADVHNEKAIDNFKPEKPKEAPPPKSRGKGRAAEPQRVNWPMYGLNPQRTRYLPARGIHPPFRKLWRYTEHPLLEFPPIYVGGTLYAVNNSGFAFALDAKTGRKLWERRIGRLNASSPTYYKHRLYIVNLVPGHIVKLNASNGKIIWKKSLPGRAESSPVVVGNSVYFGCEDGDLYSLSTVNGNIRWATQLGGPIKAAPAYYGGRLYVGDYGGDMNAVEAKNGEIVWQTGSLGTGVSGGEFYSTPAVAFGRVYAGNNDDRVYSFDLSDGELAWTYSTGGYAYSAPTVASTKHSPPTVYIGSFDGNIYALNAKDGTVRWSRSTGGQVVGSLSAIGEIVYVAEFTHQRTIGYMMHSGRKVFDYPKGTYTPIISDGQDLYLTGYSSITALEPVHPVKPKIDPAIVAPAQEHFPSHAHGEGIGKRLVAPFTPAQRRAIAARRRAARLAQLTPAQRRARAIRLRRRREAAAAAAARPARKPGKPRSEAGR